MPVIVSLAMGVENEKKVVLTKDRIMKKSLILMGVIAVFTMSAHASWRKDTRKTLKENKYACKSTQVVIDSIVKNDKIQGHISGLPVNAYQDFKVVFYVKTNRWYLHPYTDADAGYSFSNLTDNGSFEVKTVRREVASKQLVAVLLPKTTKISNQKIFLKPFLGFIGGVLKYECAHTIVQGNGDFKTL